MKYLVKLSYFFIKQAKTENSNADPCFYTWCVRMTSFLLLLSQLAVGTLHQTPHPQLSHESRAVRYPPYDLTPQNPGALKGKHGDRNDGWQPEVEKCETSSIMGEERSTVTVSPLVRARSGGTLRSTSCSQSSFTWERALAVKATLAVRRSSLQQPHCRSGKPGKSENYLLWNFKVMVGKPQTPRVSSEGFRH